jgi:hypothetical protein
MELIVGSLGLSNEGIRDGWDGEDLRRGVFIHKGCIELGIGRGQSRSQNLFKVRFYSLNIYSSRSLELIAGNQDFKISSGITKSPLGSQNLLRDHKISFPCASHSPSIHNLKLVAGNRDHKTSLR